MALKPLDNTTLLSQEEKGGEFSCQSTSAESRVALIALQSQLLIGCTQKMQLLLLLILSPSLMRAISSKAMGHKIVLLWFSWKCAFVKLEFLKFQHEILCTKLL